MADSPVSQLTAKTTPTTSDLLLITDVEDTTQSSNGTSKSLTIGNLQAVLSTNLASTTQTFTNKTFDTGGTGNVFKIAGTSVTGVTGTGNAVLATSPSLTTPTLGVASATSINKLTLTTPATGSTLTIADGKTLTANNSLTLAGTDGKTLTLDNSLEFAGTDSTKMTFPGSTDTVAGLAAAQTFTNKTIGDTLNMTTGAITQSGAAAHITLTPGASKFVKIAGLEQDITTNTYRNNLIFLTGWTFVTGDGATTAFSKAITFGITFTTAPVVTVSELGGKTASDPTSITDHSVTGTSLASFMIQNTPLATTGFTMNIYFNSAPGNGTRVLFTWTAIGTL